MENNQGQIKSFTDLIVWQLAIELIKKIYKVTKDFPREEKYALISQIRDAALSVAANIAEGFGRYHFKDNIKFLYNARGSLYEVQSFIIIACELKYLNKNSKNELLTDIKDLGVKLNNYIGSLSRAMNNH